MPVYSADPDDTYVSIHCTGTEHTPHEIWRIATFYTNPGGGKGVRQFWSEHPRLYQEPGNDTLIPISGRATQTLAGDTLVTNAEFKADHDLLNQGDARSKANLKCGRCSASVSVRLETLSPMFDVLASAEIKELTLSSLATRLRRR
jgi:hypothetical protein